MKKIITIFGSSKPINNEEQYLTAYNLGKNLTLNGFDICTGGFNGIMEAASKGAVEGGGEAIGVTVDLWGRHINEYITREIKCNTLLERIDKLIGLGDGFVVLQGGTGTLLELAAAWEYMNKDLMAVKPIVCHSSLWKKITNEMNEQMKLEGRNADVVKSFDTIEEIVEYLKGNLINTPS
ncbi:MAG TPA: LOG family protein [Ignavibacteriaceae bacterium]|nr:LOG family protein [Ignavibacteriaceae bacterium]